VLPRALPPITPKVPGSLLDETLPLNFGGGVMEPASTAGGYDALTGTHIAVSLVLSAANGGTGMVTVALPRQIVAPGMAFSFPLPAELSQAADAAPVRVTLPNGTALPSWLRYAPREKSFVANATPAGALPIEVLVHIGARSWTVVISEQRPK